MQKLNGTSQKYGSIDGAYIETDNEYQCPKCGTIKDFQDIFSTENPSLILDRFICTECGFDMYTHFRDIKQRKHNRNRKILEISICTFFIAIMLMYMCPSLYSLTGLLFLISIVVGGVSFIACMINYGFKSKIKNLNEEYRNVVIVNDQKKEKDKADKILDEFIKKEGILFNRFFNFDFDASLKLEVEKLGLECSKYFVKHKLPDYVKQKIEETEKADAGCLIDEPVSEVKKGILDNYDIDLSIVDKEIEELFKTLPVTVQDLKDEFRSEYTTGLTKTELRDDIQYNLIAINNFYSIQLKEAKKILDFGINNCSAYDFDLDSKRFNNLKFYPDFNTDLDLTDLENRYKNNDGSAVEVFASRVLNNAIYPVYVKKEFELEYNPDNGILALNYKLPNIETIPNISEISYVSAKNSFKEVPLKEKEINELYDNILYQIVLRTNYELFTSDTANNIKAIVFNGWLEYVDKADGKDKTDCILSMQASKNEFVDVNLSNVEPKQCFKKFRGIGHSGLYNTIPVPPILNLNKTDRRFVEGYDVMYKIEDGDNLATMAWQDFENLIRELFEKEFCQNGCEIKITQQSRDGGVDAVLYNNDPVTGGEIIIQAKRYCNVVSLSAVRDLYGTMTDRRAMKGILITTSYYGSDSYEFVKDKPITLLDGSYLKNLLNKHGYNARIDLKEAKALMKQQQEAKL